MKHYKVTSLFLLTFLLMGCNKEMKIPDNFHLYGDEMSSFLPEVGETKLLFKHSLEETVGDDGEDYFYNYCPSIKIDNEEMHTYYCTNKDWGNVTDYIGYRHGHIFNKKLYQSDESLVLSPTADTWDERHVCDPTVIKGEFLFNGETYNYLMAYLGCVPSDCTLNETGIAVSKTPKGPWVKCNGNTDDGRAINPIVPYSDFDCKSTNWGTGQASLVSVDNKGRVILFTTVGCPTGSFMNIREYDFSNINNYTKIRETKMFTDGVLGSNPRINNADYCYDKVNKKFIMAKGRSPFGEDGLTPNFIASQVDVYYLDASSYENPFDIFFDNNRTSKWTFIGTIDQKLSGYPRNHNTGLITNAYGELYGDNKIGVAFTSSQYGSSAAMSYLKTYRIFVTSFTLPYLNNK